jgi:hypothetical protein
MIFLILQNPEVKVLFFLKLQSIPTAKQGARPIAFIINIPILRDPVLLEFTLRWLFCPQLIFLTHEDAERQALFLSTSISIFLGKQNASASCFYHPQFSYNLCSACCIHLKQVILLKGDVPHALRARQ